MTKFNMICLYFASKMDDIEIYNLKRKFQNELSEENFFKHKILWNGTKKKHRKGAVEKNKEHIRHLNEKMDMIMEYKKQLKRNPDLITLLDGFNITISKEKWLS